MVECSAHDRSVVGSNPGDNFPLRKVDKNEKETGNGKWRKILENYQTKVDEILSN